MSPLYLPSISPVSPQVLLARSVIYHPFGVEQIDFHPDQEIWRRYSGDVAEM